MNTTTVGALRQLLIRGRTAGWEHTIYEVAGDREHVWSRPVPLSWCGCPGNEVGGHCGTCRLAGARQRVSLYAGFLVIDPNRDDATTRTWTVPAESVDQVAKVLELAGMLPAECGCLAYDLRFNAHAPEAHTNCAQLPPCGGCDSCISAQVAHYQHERRVTSGGAL